MEVIHRGMTFKYLPSASVLSVTIRFWHVHQQNDVKHHLRVRGVIMIDDDYSNTSIEGNAWLLHSDKILSGHPIKEIDLRNFTVMLADYSTITIADAINEMNELI
jgi:hypothetical protein